MGDGWRRPQDISGLGVDVSYNRGGGEGNSAIKASLHRQLQAARNVPVLTSAAQARGTSPIQQRRTQASKQRASRQVTN